MSDEDFLRNQREIFTDRQYDAALEATTEAAGESEAAAFGSGGDLDAGGEGLGGDEGGLELDDLGGGDDTGGLDLGGDDTGGDEGGDTGGEAEEPILPELPAAGKRDDTGKKYTEASLEPQAKGKKYVSSKSTGGDRRVGQAARKRSTRYSQAGVPLPKSPFPGWKGPGGMSSLARGVIQEQQTTYSNSAEIELFESTMESKRLIEQLEQIGKLEKITNENEA